MSKTMELTVIPAANLPTILAADQNDILGKIATKLKHHKPDVSTVSGRAEIRSLAAEIASSKMDLIRLGKGLTEGWRKSTKAVNDECGVIEERMNSLRDQVRAPLTEFENREKVRVAAHEAALAEIENWVSWPTEGGSAEIAARLAELETHPYHERDWEEFAARAGDTYTGSVNALKRMLAAAAKRELEAAELVRLREAEAKRQAEADALALIAREEQIARDAAEKAAREVQQKADREAREVEERNQTALREAALAQERERAEALRKEREAAETLALAERNRLAAEDRERAAAQMAEAARVAAERKAETERLAAIEAERARVAKEAAAQKAEDDRRAADKAHRGKINREAMAVLVAALLGVDGTAQEEAEVFARATIEAIARGMIPHVKIEY